MHCDIQNLADFKRLLLNDEIEEARKIFASKQNTFKKEVKTPSALKDLPHDDFATYLIPEDVNRAKGHRLFALKATLNGDCLFNAVSILLCGNESNSMLLRLLVAGELYFNAPFYANHSVFTDTTRVCTDLTLETLFSIALTKAGDEKMSETGNKLDAVKAEALVACTPGKWSSFMHVLGLASVISNPVRSIYPDVNFRFRSLIHRCVSPRSCPTLDQPCGDQEPLSILWSRDGDFDNRPGAWFEPNHFVPVISQSEGENVNQLPAKQGKTTGSGKKQQGTLFSFVQTKSKSKLGADNISPTCTESPMPSHKRNAETAKLSGDAQPNVKKSATSSITQKIRHKWKDEFPWLIISEDNLVLCSVCCNAPEVAGKSQFLTGCSSTKKETMQKHAISKNHMCAQAAVLAKQKPVRETVLAQSFSKGRKDQEEKDQREVAVKMTTAYFLAKEEIPFSKFQGLINLQRKNGLELTSTYANNKTCTEMVSVVGKMFKEGTAAEINQVSYISVMADGATDAGGIENETVFCRYVQDGRPVNRLIGHKAVEHANAEGK